MKIREFRFVMLALVAGLMLVEAQAQNPPQGGGGGGSNPGGATVDGWRGFLSINYKGGKFVMPYARIVSVARHDYLVDGAGRVHELTVDTNGTVIARYYFLESGLDDSPIKAVGIINNRLEKTGKLLEKRTGVDRREVVKHYPDTTHAKTVEFNVSEKEHLDAIYSHITHEWIEEGGRGAGRTLKFE